MANDYPDNADIQQQMRGPTVPIFRYLPVKPESREGSVELRCKRSIFSGLPSVLWYRKKRYEEELNEAKGKLKSQVGERKLIVLITGDIFSAVLHRICCDALHSTQVSSHAIYILELFYPKKC